MVTIMATANIWLLGCACGGESKAGLQKEHIKGLNQLNGTEFLPLVARARICSRAGLNSPL
jgi:hypothetical protein